jgi:GntR family transcriptional regulator
MWSKVANTDRNVNSVASVSAVMTCGMVAVVAEIDPDDSRAPYIRVADGLRAAIQAGDLAPGSPLPSLPQICAAHEVSPGTARNAVRVMREEGLVVTRQGKGTFVRTAPARGEVPATAGELSEVRRELSDLAARVAAVEQRLPG